MWGKAAVELGALSLSWQHGARPEGTITVCGPTRHRGPRLPRRSIALHPRGAASWARCCVGARARRAL